MAAPVSVGFFVTCLVDFFRPSVAFASIRLLEQAGCEVTVPTVQTCCGQPGYNAGAHREARRVAKNVIDAFESFPYVVVPSASCASMIKVEYPRLFSDDPAYLAKANTLASRTHELVSFLVDVRGIKSVGATFDGGVAYHDSCSALRELGIHQQPRALLGSIPGLRLLEINEGQTCCGFGGTFCVKYSEISVEMVRQKTAQIRATGADLLVSTDMGCLLNLQGRLCREEASTKVRHIAEVLSGALDTAPIGAGD